MRKVYIFYIFILLLLPLVASRVEATSNQNSKTAPSEAISSNFKDVVLTIGDQKETVTGEQLKSWISIEPALKINSDKRAEIENIFYCPISPVTCRLISSLNAMAFLKKETKISLDSGKIENFVNELSQRINKDPVNATFKAEDTGIVAFTPDQKGISLDVPGSVNVLSEELIKEADSQNEGEISLPYVASEPELKSSDVNNLGINTLIGEGTSNFRGSPKNRIFNINVGTEKFNGVLIKPGEEFSFVKTLGPVDGEHGYAPELVIKQDKTEPEFGGGICQVSTTAFRAAINSGLKITARKNHAYPVSYYNPQGMDATVYIPRPDLRFINNTPGYILIQTKIEGTILTFQFFGTDDGRKVEIIGPKITERNPDGSMKATFTQKMYDKDGNTVIDDVFNSNYDSPSKYPHPGEQKLTTKPNGWSDKEWKKYKQTNGI
jgi:vancomycin resistance protein YoaR